MDGVELATAAAKIGGEVLVGYWEQLGKEHADFKGRNDWVSKADRESEEAIKRFILAHCPNDSILGEESGETVARVGGSDRTWIIDPLDGTSNYLQHFPMWCVSIALREGEEMIAGVVYDPLREHVFAAERGSGAFRNGARMEVSDHPGLAASFIATGFPFRAQKHLDTYCAIFRDVIAISKGVRRAGSAALDLAYTAAGVFDGFFELHLALWDVAAGSLLVREAGGIVTDFSGGNRFYERGNIVGAAPPVHRELLELIGQHAREEELDR